MSNESATLEERAVLSKFLPIYASGAPKAIKLDDHYNCADCSQCSNCYNCASPGGGGDDE